MHTHIHTCTQAHAHKPRNPRRHQPTRLSVHQYIQIYIHTYTHKTRNPRRHCPTISTYTYTYTHTHLKPEIREDINYLSVRLWIHTHTHTYIHTYTRHIKPEIREDINYSSVRPSVSAHDIFHTPKIRIPSDSEYESREMDEHAVFKGEKEDSQTDSKTHAKYQDNGNVGSSLRRASEADDNILSKKTGQARSKRVVVKMSSDSGQNRENGQNGRNPDALGGTNAVGKTHPGRQRMHVPGTIRVSRWDLAQTRWTRRKIETWVEADGTSSVPLKTSGQNGQNGDIGQNGQNVGADGQLSPADPKNSGMLNPSPPPTQNDTRFLPELDSVPYLPGHLIRFPDTGQSVIMHNITVKGLNETVENWANLVCVARGIPEGSNNANVWAEFNDRRKSVVQIMQAWHHGVWDVVQGKGR
jgi:hypothetical protein